ncbi:MAG: hypothetical protein HYX90_03735 [Chloroflexi bacterium]|nr:hypothetical protein [Chloroflexota bacterium]
MKVCRKCPANRAGMALIETLLAIAILGVTSVAFLGAVGTAEKAAQTSDEHVAAESLARQQLEYLKDSSYINYSVFGHPTYSAIAMPGSYAMSVTAVPINPSTLLALPEGQDQGLQDLVVAVARNGRTVFTLHTYKVAR